MKHTYFKIPGWFNYSETYDMIVDQIPEDGKIVEHRDSIQDVPGETGNGNTIY